MRDHPEEKYIIEKVMQALVRLPLIRKEEEKFHQVIGTSIVWGKKKNSRTFFLSLIHI